MHVKNKLKILLSFRFLFLILVFLLYISFASFQKNGPNPSSHFVLTKSLALYGNINVSFKDIQFYSGGIDFAKNGENYYSDKAPGISFLVLPLYYLGNFLFLQGINFPIADAFNYPSDANAFFLIIIFLTLLNSYGVLKLYDLLVRLKIKKIISFYAALIFAFATIFWGYATTLFSHGIAATSIILAIYFLIRNDRRNLLLSGLFTGFLATVEYTALIFIPIFIIKLIHKQKLFVKTIPYIFGLAIPLGFLLLYNYLAFGNPLIFSYQTQANFSDAANFNRPLFDGLDILLFSSWRGLFFFNPILIFSIGGMFIMFQKNRNLALFLVVLWLANLVLFAKYNYVWGGVAYGPRYLISTIPILIIFLAEFLSRISFRIADLLNISFFILLAISFFHSFLGAYTSIFAYPESNKNPIYEITLQQFLQGTKSSFLLNSSPIIFGSLIVIAIFLLFYFYNFKMIEVTEIVK